MSAKKSAPRPSKKSPEICSEIVARLSTGEPMAVICRDDYMPGVTTVWQWAQDDKEFAESIARARIDGHDAIAARLRETARGMGESTRDVQRDKLIIETDLKLLAKWDPKRYGERVDIEAKHSGTIRVVLGGNADEPPR